LLAQTNDAEPGAEETPETLEAAQPTTQIDDNEQPGAPQSRVPKGLHDKKLAEAERIKSLQSKQIQALTSNLGKLEGKVSEMTAKYEELQKKDAL